MGFRLEGEAVGRDCESSTGPEGMGVRRAAGAEGSKALA